MRVYLTDTSQHRGKLVYRLLQHAMVVDPTTYDDIIKHDRGPKKRSDNMQYVPDVNGYRHYAYRLESYS